MLASPTVCKILLENPWKSVTSSIQIIDTLTCFHVMLTSPPPLDYGVLNTFFGFRNFNPVFWDFIAICYKVKLH